MQCDKCRNEAVFFQPYSGRQLCGRHLSADIEVRAKRSIRAHRWLGSGDHIAVMISGDRKSGALLYFMQKLIAGRRDIRLSAVPASGEDHTTVDRSGAMTIAESLRIPFIRELPRVSGAAAQETITKIAKGFSLDDVAAGVLEQFLFGDAGHLIYSRSAVSSPIPVICPFITIPSDELDLYWDCQSTGIALVPSTPRPESLRTETAALLEKYSRRHPATKFALLHLREQLSCCTLPAAPCRARDTAGTGRGNT